METKTELISVLWQPIKDALLKGPRLRGIAIVLRQLVPLLLDTPLRDCSIFHDRQGRDYDDLEAHPPRCSL